MRKNDAPPATVSSETKPLMIGTLLAVTVFMVVIMLIWELRNYSSDNMFSTTTVVSISTHRAAEINGSSSAATSMADHKEKRVFTAYGNAAALFVKMGAYRGGPNTFAVVGLASKPIHVYGHPWFEYEWVSNANSSPPSTRFKAWTMLPDWGAGRVYTVVVVNCTFYGHDLPNHDNAGGKLFLYAYYDESESKYEKILALEEAPGTYDESKYKPPYPYEYFYCGSSLYGDLSASRMREWMAYHAWLFGSRSHFVFHDAGGVTPEVMAVLEPWIRAGRVTVEDIRAQAEYDGFYYNQYLVLNDCLHRYRHAANWTFFFDIDEYIYLPRGTSTTTLQSVLQQDQFSNYTQITFEQRLMTVVLCSNDSSRGEWGFEKLVFWDTSTEVELNYKYALQARNTYATGIHMSDNVVGGTLMHETNIWKYHYHNSINQHDDGLCKVFLPESTKLNVTCRFDNSTFVYDDNMKKLAPIIKDFERATISHHIS